MNRLDNRWGGHVARTEDDDEEEAEEEGEGKDEEAAEKGGNQVDCETDINVQRRISSEKRKKLSAGAEENPIAKKFDLEIEDWSR